MISISKRLNVLKRKALVATSIALSFAMLTPKTADAVDFHLNFSLNVDGEKRSIGTGSFSVDDDGKIIDFSSTNSLAQTNLFTKENIKRGSFDLQTKQFKELKLKNGVTLKLNKNHWRLKSNGNLIEKGKYKVTKKKAKSVPEPLTILGSVTAIGIGGLLKKQHSSQLKKQ
ncbi:MAG: PEP-CTERM sorting domain-containing protein [Symploca sp. SIO3C6]|nr:PEP-CTERM sorting domain-containing protein [Symploca sp. SIO3C6]